MSARALIVGLGDLGRRLAAGLASAAEVGELVVAGRRAEEGPPLAALLAACGTARVRFEELDAADQGAVERLLRRERPDLVVQCAALLSPWLVPARLSDAAGGAAAAALRSAGFALQLPGQLPLVHRLMRAAAAAGITAPVVNCSYPDLVHPVLACKGLSPLAGIGNAGMIHLLAAAALRAQGREGPAVEPVRVLAHHAHVHGAVTARPPDGGLPRPRVLLGEAGERTDDLAYAGPPLRYDRELNALTTASGLPLLRALVGGPAVRTSAPGPAGRPGGWPVRVADGRLELDLPPGTDAVEAAAFQRDCARYDGVAAIEPDGTVVFTGEAQAALAPFDPALAEPLHPDGAEARLERLTRLLRLG